MDLKSAAYAWEEIRMARVDMPSHIAVTGCITKDCKRNEGHSEVEVKDTHISNYNKKWEGLEIAPEDQISGCCIIGAKEQDLPERHERRI